MSQLIPGDSPPPLIAGQTAERAKRRRYEEGRAGLGSGALVPTLSNKRMRLVCGWSGNAPGSIINYALLRCVGFLLLEEKLLALLEIKKPVVERVLVGISIRRMFA